MNGILLRDFLIISDYNRTSFAAIEFGELNEQLAGNKLLRTLTLATHGIHSTAFIKEESPWYNLTLAPLGTSLTGG